MGKVKTNGPLGKKPVWKRILVVIAGGIFNIILGFVLMLILYGQQDVFATTQIAGFTENSSLEAAGAQVGDYIVEVDHYAVFTGRDLSFALALADPNAVHFVVKRDGQKVDLERPRCGRRVRRMAKRCWQWISRCWVSKILLESDQERSSRYHIDGPHGYRKPERNVDGAVLASMILRGLSERRR